MQITIREPGSALTHFIGMLLAAIATLPLLLRTALSSNSAYVNAMTIFTISMILLYGASTLYHSVNLQGKYLEFFKKVDHIMIFVLIAGSYTPICIIALGGRLGYTLLLVVWSIAFLGMLIKALWINCPKWFSSIIYIALGWACATVFTKLPDALGPTSFGFLLAGGVIYTIGGVIYALKISALDEKFKFFGTHEIFHLFVMGGSICHFICMYNLAI